MSKSLFDRMGTGLKLTKEGEIFFRYAERFEHLADLVEKNVVGDAGVEGCLRVGALETITQCWLPDFVSELHRNSRGSRSRSSRYIGKPARRPPRPRDRPRLPARADLGALGQQRRAAAFPAGVVQIRRSELARRPCGLSGQARDLVSSPDPALPRAQGAAAGEGRAGRDHLLVLVAFGVLPLGGSRNLRRRLAQALGDPFVARGSIVEFDPGWLPGPLQFTASYLGDPKSHMIEAAARAALPTARRHAGIEEADQDR